MPGRGCCSGSCAAWKKATGSRPSRRPIGRVCGSGSAGTTTRRTWTWAWPGWLARGWSRSRPGTEQSHESYGVHPGVAAAGRVRAGKQFRDAVDVELAAFWRAVADDAVGREAEARTTGLVVRAGLAAAPYLLRQEAMEHGWLPARTGVPA